MKLSRGLSQWVCACLAKHWSRRTQRERRGRASFQPRQPLSNRGIKLLWRLDPLRGPASTATVEIQQRNCVFLCIGPEEMNWSPSVPTTRGAVRLLGTSVHQGSRYLGTWVPGYLGAFHCREDSPFNDNHWTCTCSSIRNFTVSRPRSCVDICSAHTSLEEPNSHIMGENGNASDLPSRRPP